MSDSSSSAGGGIGLGTVLAMILSWTKWHSIFWVIVHGCLSWLYVIYWAVTR